MKRLHAGWNVQGDCIVSHRFPLSEADPPGVYLGEDSRGQDVYISYWTALDIAQMVGYPPIETVEANAARVDELEQKLADVEAQIDELVDSHVDQKFIKLLEQTKGEILEEQKRTVRSLRDSSKLATDPDASRTAKLVRREGSSTRARSSHPGDATAITDEPDPGNTIL